MVFNWSLFLLFKFTGMVFSFGNKCTIWLNSKINYKNSCTFSSLDFLFSLFYWWQVGRVLLNALLYPGIKTNPQKNSLVAIFHTSVTNVKAKYIFFKTMFDWFTCSLLRNTIWCLNLSVDQISFVCFSAEKNWHKNASVGT